MSGTLLAVNVGNTRTQFGTFVDDKLSQVLYVANSEKTSLVRTLGQAYEPIRDESPMVYMAAVSETQAARVQRALHREFGQRAIRIEKDAVAPIGRQLDPETLVGEDRLLNAAAAYDRTRQACVVIDAGTAVTVDFVDGAGTFHGGAILPGAQMMLDSMTNRTELLPSIQFERPMEEIGRNTTQAMLTGVFHTIRGATRELVEQYATLLGSYPRVIATGGNARILFEDYDLVEMIIDELTLLGIAVTHRIALGPADE